jgi:hypothetical protein
MNKQVAELLVKVLPGICFIQIKEGRQEACPTTEVASLLNPNNALPEAAGDFDALAQSIQEVYGHYCRDAAQISTRKRTTEGQSLHKYFKSVPAPRQDQEVYLYLLDRRNSTALQDANPLVYWSAKKAAFPTLHRMARAYLAIPTTTSASKLAIANAKVVLLERPRILDPVFRVEACIAAWITHLEQAGVALPEDYSRDAEELAQDPLIQELLGDVDFEDWEDETMPWW